MAASRTSSPLPPTADEDLAARAAWLHFVGGLTQSEVARRLNVSTTRAHRSIARAQSAGLVRVFVDVEAEECVRLELALMRRFGLRHCRVAMEVPETGALPLKALSVLGADFLMRAIDSGEHKVIGVGNGRTLTASVDAMGRCAAPQVRFVSVLGGLTRSYAANPYDVIHRLARKTGADAYLMPAPIFANSAEDKNVMLAQFGVAATMKLVRDASLIVLGIGALDGEGGVTSSTLEGPGAIEALHGAGAVAEVLGQFIDARGCPVDTPYDTRVMAPALETLRGREIVAIAGGAAKRQAILASLHSGLLTGLIIDEATARAIVGEPDASAAPVTG